MAGYATRRLSKLQTSVQKSPIRRRVTRRKAISKNNSNIDATLDTKTNVKTRSKRLSTESRVSAKKPLKISNNSKERGSRIATRKTSSESKTNASTKSRKNVISESRKRNEDDGSLAARKLRTTKSKNVSVLRQMSLKESFTNQAIAKRLRTRQITQKNHDGSMSNTKSFSSDVPECSVVLDVLRPGKSKVPVYKSVPLEDSTKNKNEIYDFKYDSDDSRKRVPKRRKKQTAKKTVIRKRKNVVTKKKNVDDIKTNVVTDPKPVQKEDKASIAVAKDENSAVAPATDTSKVLENHEQPEDATTSIFQEPPSAVDNVAAEQPAIALTKPTIRSIENLTKKTVTVVSSSPMRSSEDFLPLRPINVFSNKNNNNVNQLAVKRQNMLNASLFEKSLSPILKSENVDFGSPWRVVPHTFSQARSAFQSTPQNVLNVSRGKPVRAINAESRNFGGATKAKDAVQRQYENVAADKVDNTRKKSLTTVRKFGTEITNRDKSMHSSTQIADTSENVATDVQTQLLSQSATPIGSNVNVSNLNVDDDKENTILNFQTPKAVSKRGIKKNKARSPKISAASVVQTEQKENFDPQPGPSGLQNLKLSDEQRVLRQSNLNNFLSLEEFPERSTIRTPHGIFDDTNPSPISRKPAAKPEKSDIEIKTAFGFDDDDSYVDAVIEATREKEKNTVSAVPEKRDAKRFVPARLSINEIQNNLLPRNPKEKVGSKLVLETKSTKAEEISKKQKKTQIDILNFSDTFDILSEAGSVDTSNVPLFADLEPVRFTKPPRHSYKRKRNVRFSLSDHESSEEETPEIVVKRKKVGKAQKQDDKRVLEWITNLNETFEEIDQHHLVIE